MFRSSAPLWKTRKCARCCLSYVFATLSDSEGHRFIFSLFLSFIWHSDFLRKSENLKGCITTVDFCRISKFLNCNVNFPLFEITNVKCPKADYVTYGVTSFSLRLHLCFYLMQYRVVDVPFSLKI